MPRRARAEKQEQPRPAARAATGEEGQDEGWMWRVGVGATQPTTHTWLRCKATADAFDASNWAGPAPHREGVRLVSHAQEGAGAHHSRLPDPSLVGSVIESACYTASVQRQLGLYLSCLAAPLDAMAARGDTVSQAERLGDTCLHASNATRRHNAGLAAIFTALSSATATGVKYSLGDKGDGTPAGKEDARRRHAHLNATHIPDIIRYGASTTLLEYKCWAIYLPRGAQGNGSARLGGAASEVEGWRFAFGREEALRTMHLGHGAHGADGDAIYDRLTGEGRLTCKRGAYSDGADKGHNPLLLVSEPSGACSPGLTGTLRAVSKSIGLPGIQDTTVYGTSRVSQSRSYFAHHIAAISSAIVLDDALTP